MSVSENFKLRGMQINGNVAFPKMRSSFSGNNRFIGMGENQVYLPRVGFQNNEH